MTGLQTPNNYFEMEQIVDLNHIDDLNHVNNAVYLEWINDISKRHWIKLSNEKIRLKNIWVVLRHEIDYLKASYLDDKLLIRTWVGDSSGFKSIRHTEVYKNNIVIAKAKSTWCLLDPKSLKPQRITDEIFKLFRF